jgi:flagellar biogenesis protein FliO
VEEGEMAMAWPLAVRDFLPRARATNSRGSRGWWRAVVPALLVCAGALVLAPPWKGAAPSPASPASAPAKAPDSLLPPTAGVDATTLLGALLVVGGALAAMPWILARVTSRARRGGEIDLVEVRPLGGRRSLMLVQVGRRRFLIGASEQGMAALAELDAAKSFAEVASETPLARDGNADGSAG